MIPKIRIKILYLLLWLLGVVSVFCVLKASDEPILTILKNTSIASLLQQFETGNSIIFSLSIGYIISGIFYLLVVWLPNWQRRRLIRENFEKQYFLFKEEAIKIFLSASDRGYDSRFPSKLTDQKAFKDYFKKSVNGIRKWDVVHNELNDILLKDLLVELEIFMNEVAFILNNVLIDDQNVFSFFKRLSQAVYRLKNSTLGYDDKKRLLGFLWELFAGWSFIDGYRVDDIVKIMIKKI